MIVKAIVRKARGSYIEVLRAMPTQLYHNLTKADKKWIRNEDNLKHLLGMLPKPTLELIYRNL